MISLGLGDVITVQLTRQFEASGNDPAPYLLLEIGTMNREL